SSVFWVHVPEITTARRSAEWVWSGDVQPAGNLWNAPCAPCVESPHVVAVITTGAAGFGSHFSWSGVIVTSDAFDACFATRVVFASLAFSANAEPARTPTTTAHRT